MKRKFTRKAIVLARHIFAKMLYLQTLYFKKRFDPRLVALVSKHSLPNQPNKRVLVDGTWDNPNYWLHVAVMAAAQNVSLSNSIGLVGRYASKEVLATFSNLGMQTADLIKDYWPQEEEFTVIVEDLMSDIDGPDAIFDWHLPEDFPSESFYDTLLKFQREPYVNPLRPDFRKHLLRALQAIIATKRMLEDLKPEVVFCSHNIGEIAGPLAWNAMRMGLKTYVLYGDFGGSRYLSINSEAAFRVCLSAPTPEELASCKEGQLRNLRKNGRKYMQERLLGTAGDIGSVTARVEGCANLQFERVYSDFSWSHERPIVTIFMQNWYDYPNSFGLNRFRDFYDWAIETLTVAKEVTDVNWLVRAHPLDGWYGVSDEVSVKNIVKALNLDHIKICPSDVGSEAAIRGSAGVVTACGTVGVEAPALGTPSLVSEEAWYGRHPFVLQPRGRQAYLDTLRTSWWNIEDRKNIQKSAEIFLGFYFGFPSWQKGYILEDTSKKNDLYHGLHIIMDKSERQIFQEIQVLRDWLDSDQVRYHIFKNLSAKDYIHASRTNSYAGTVK